MKFIFLVLSFFSICSYAQENNLKPIEEFKLKITSLVGTGETYQSEYRVYKFAIGNKNSAFNSRNLSLELFCSQRGQKSKIYYERSEYKFPVEHLPERPPGVSKTFCTDLVTIIQQHLSVGRNIEITFSYTKKEVLKLDSIEE